MGFVRGIFLVLISIVFILSIFSSGVLYTISSSLKYDAIQNQAVSIVESFANQLNLSQNINSNLGTIQQTCQTSSDYIFYYDSYALHFSCQYANDMSLIIKDTAKNLISNLYYQKYDCNYWDCFGKYSPPLFLISEKSESYWSNLFYYSLAAIIASAALLFFLFKRKHNLLFFAGVIVIISSFLLKGIENLIELISGQIISGILPLFFSQSGLVFTIMIIIGVGLIFAGLIIELFKAGFKIYDMFSRIGDSGDKSKAKSIGSGKK